MKITHISTDYKRSTRVVPESIGMESWRPALVRQVILSQRSNRRANTAHAKDRAAVVGADKKPWRQKGTGRARHGSRYSPIWRGGGVTFGPLNTRNYTKKISSRMRKVALRSSIFHRIEADEAMSAVLPEFSEPNTKQASEWVKGVISALNTDGKNPSILVVLPDTQENALLSMRNLGQVNIKLALDLNAEDVMTPKVVLFAERSLDILAEKTSTTTTNTTKELASS